ncbi:nuclear fragile X mental retardation-interacting protein 1-domain-containing protein [Halteromyces radiatus]|uniref:nuclear fragile X mental retardation-interacting protein 1-domain-containing protein n=1 Tax=Halteromyces radiatus TaxID=101107 RepID=UPI002220F629|nr:nuclear fragile X mental retardation-interacting protein 1-domain-containing protein [Halteromyces radiatus]KAI8097541.1 nuclear fragile X mental retardation-interacting protein 1-domain-containing protein [Halteromyces radiatus]
MSNNKQSHPSWDPSHSEYTNTNERQFPSIYYELQQQTQKLQARGALAAASLNSMLNPTYRPQPVSYDELYQDPVPTTSQATDSTQSQKNGGVCCNKWYKTQIALDQHRSIHIKCKICSTFEGNPAFVQVHQEEVHGVASNKKKKDMPDGIVPANAPKLDTPEAIAAWIEERKKNWPSKANVERKQQQEQEREARGELPRDNKYNKNKRKATSDQQESVGNKKHQATITPSSSLPSLVNYDSDSDEEFHSAEEDFPDISKSNNDDDDHNEENEDDTMDLQQDAVSSKDPTSMGKLTLPPATTTRPRKLCKYFVRGNCTRGDQCHFLHEKPKSVSQNHSTRDI